MKEKRKALKHRIVLFGAFSFLFFTEAFVFGQNSVDISLGQQQIKEQKEILAHFSMGVIYDNEKKSSLALHEYDQVLERDPKLYYVLYKKGVTLLQEDQVEEGLEALKQAVIFAKDDMQPLFILSTAYALLKEMDKAQKGYLKILQKQPKNTKALRALADIYIVQKKYMEALEIYQRLNIIEGDKNTYLFEKGVLYAKTGQTEKAFKVLEKEQFKRNVHALLVLGKLYENRQKIQAAIDTYKRILEIEPFNIDALQNLATIYAQNFDIDKAYSLFDRIMANKEKDTTLLLSYAIFCLEQNDHVKGFELLEELASLDDQKIYIVVGYLYLVYNRPNEAIFNLDKALIKKEGNAFCYYLLAIAYDMLGEDLLCYKGLRKALGLKNDFHQAYNYLGVKFLEEKEHLKEAEALLKKAIEIDPENLQYTEDLGSLYLQQNRLFEAKKIFEQALSMDASIETYEYLSDIHMRLGNSLQSIAFLEKILEKEPDRQDIIKKIITFKNKEQEG